MQKNMDASYKEVVTRETRLWIAVIPVLILAEVGMHEFSKSDAPPAYTHPMST